ncbi:serine/threonine-protein phosphatase [Streptomyces sp. NBC_00161]|uniref:SpoIIE family protein phosphatase n=1 Tax=Streptomyces sp. NBC_00161 TaxID=2975671 RepID=UPI00325019C5
MILSTALAAHPTRQERNLVHANSVAEALMRALLRPAPHQVGQVLISRGEVRRLDGPPALPLGLGSLAAADGPVAWSHRLTRGDVLLLVTDGLVEARDTGGDFHPLVDRLRHRFAGRVAPGPADVVNFLNTDLPRHTRNLHDDIARLAIAPHSHI